MINSARYRISLRITHPSIASGRISKELGLIPKFCYTSGDQKLTPKGEVLPGIRKESFWTYELVATDEPFEQTLEAFNSTLKDKEPFLNEINQTGGRLEYFVGWFATGDSGFSLAPHLLSQLVAIGIKLTINVYVEKP
ncbi:DUF4279 domain-containing protein [Pseudomonas sp. CGJS7]|uniref:DUF4279 domain-containing protein n=1 Tax=Pseudomonas sp. CGJS7 TaxID=3109348 RepID=UPI003008036F